MRNSQIVGYFTAVFWAFFMASRRPGAALLMALEQTSDDLRTAQTDLEAYRALLTETLALLHAVTIERDRYLERWLGCQDECRALRAAQTAPTAEGHA
jgi:hypothetical protein